MFSQLHGNLFKFFLTSFFIVCVLVSSIFQESAVRHDLFILKYILIFILTVLSLSGLKKREVLIPLTLIVLVFLVGGRIPEALSGACCILIAYRLSFLIPSNREKKLFIILLIVFLIPIIHYLIFLYDTSFLSTKYGRPRVPLGYDHPRDSAGLALLASAYFLFNRPRMFFLFGCLFAYLFDSRNVLIVSILQYFSCNLRPHLFYKFVLTVLTVFLLAFSAVIYKELDAYEIINLATSNRLAIWQDAIQNRSQYKNSFEEVLTTVPRTYFDSFWIEVYVKSGNIGTVISMLLLPLLLRPFLRVGSMREQGVLMGAGLGIVFFSVFDSGIASAGNIVHITLWALYFLGLRMARRKISDTGFR